jgi:hypothetical protein
VKVEPRCNKGEPRFAFGWVAAVILAELPGAFTGPDADEPLHREAVRVVGAEGLEPPTYAL